MSRIKKETYGNFFLPFDDIGLLFSLTVFTKTNIPNLIPDLSMLFIRMKINLPEMK